MFTLVGYYDASAHAALAAIAGIPDPHVRVQGNDIYVPNLNKLLGVFAGGSGISDCRLQSPSLRRMVNQRVTPVYPEPLPVGSWYGERGLFWKEAARTLDVAEALNAFCLNTAAAAEYVFVFLMDKLEALPAGEMITIEGTVTVTGIVGNWVNGALTFGQTLPAGRYAVIGMRAQAHENVASRLVFPDTSPRPGCMGRGHYYEQDTPETRYGGLGNWGEFEHDAPPTIDILANAATAITHTIALDLIQVRSGRG